MMFLTAADGLFSWVQFSIDRIKNPLVITGLAIIALGILCATIANPINNQAKVQAWEEEHKKSDTYVAGILRIGGYVLMVIGCILAAVVK